MSSDLQPHQQRVVDEFNDLDSKIAKLSTFIYGNIYKTLPGDEQRLLSVQLVHMQGYRRILNMRIALFQQ
jgi:hypothetical protein